ncbi:MAG: transposase [Candidatus Cloacimonetes bacterium]|nr:transposase [Candidatus Cloacimonadota bacterium]
MKAKFYWQRGFGVFSVSESNIDDVRNYILNQLEH